LELTRDASVNVFEVDDEVMLLMPSAHQKNAEHDKKIAKFNG
jgi:hypothetical protein